MAVNRDNKFRNALEVFKQHCDSKDALLDAYLEKIIANTKSLVEKAKEMRKRNDDEIKVVANTEKSKAPIERSRPMRHAAEVAKTLIHSSMRLEKTYEKMRRPENFNPNLMCSTLDILKAEIESENKNIDQTVSEHNFIRHLKNNTSTTFESTLIGANNRFDKPEPIPNGDSVDLNQLTIPMSTFRNDDETFVVVTNGKKSCEISETIVVNGGRDQESSESTLKMPIENNASSSSSSSSHYSLRSSKKRTASNNNIPEFEKEPKKLVQNRDLSHVKQELEVAVPEAISHIVDVADQNGDNDQVDSKTALRKMIKSSKKVTATKAKTKVASKFKNEDKPKHIVVLNLSDIVEEKSDESPEAVPTVTKVEAPRTPRTPRIRTRAMTKRLLQLNAAVQSSPTKQIDAQIEEAALKRQGLLEKRRENARRKREENAKKAFEQREILRTEKLKKLNQKKSKKDDEPQIPNKKPLVELKNQPRPSPPASPTVAPKSETIRPPPILPPPPHCSNQTKTATRNVKESITLNLDECDSDADEYNSNAVSRICNWVKKRQYDSEHATSESSLLKLFCTGPAKPNICDIFEEVEQIHLLRNSSIWED